MAEGRVSQIVPQGNGLCQIFIQPKCPGNGACHLCHFQRVGQASAVMIPFRSQKDLGLKLQPSESLAVNNAIPIPLKIRPQGAGSHRLFPSPAIDVFHRQGRQAPLLFRLKLFPDGHASSLPFCK